MSLFSKKYIGKQIAVPPVPDPARVAALRDWAASIKSGRIASLKETELHGPFMELMIKALGYTGPVGSHAYSITQEQAWEYWWHKPATFHMRHAIFVLPLFQIMFNTTPSNQTS